MAEVLTINHEEIKRKETEIAVREILQEKLGCAKCALKDTCFLVDLVVPTIAEADHNLIGIYNGYNKMNELLKTGETAEKCEFLQSRFREFVPGHIILNPQGTLKDWQSGK